MYIGITNLERFILESLNRSEKDIISISKDLKLDLKITHNCLNQLCAKNLISIEGNKYFINQEVDRRKVNYINSKESLTGEFTRLIENHIEDSIYESKDNFALKKVYLNNDDEILLGAMLKSLESFLAEINSKNRKQKFNTNEKSYIFWGFNKYQNIINNL